MKRSEHEAIVREHIGALAWANDARTKEFVRGIAANFGIIDFPDTAAIAEERDRSAFAAEHRAFHRNKPKTRSN